MKTLNVTFTDGEYNKLTKAKKKFYSEKNMKVRTWHEFILTKYTKGVSVKRNGNKKILE